MEHATFPHQRRGSLLSVIHVIINFFTRFLLSHFSRNTKVHTPFCGTRDGAWESRRDIRRDSGRDSGRDSRRDGCRDNAGCIDIRINKFFEIDFVIKPNALR